MASITSYITSTEANYSYPNDTNWSANQRAEALKESKGLVDSFINSKYKLPVLGEWDGQSEIAAPYILKWAQKRLYRFILESSNVGNTEDLQGLWDATVSVLENLREGQLDIPSEVYDNEPGWHIANITQASNIGGVWIRGVEMQYRLHYRVVITSSGARYVGDGALTYSVYRSDSATALATDQIATLQWDSYSDSLGSFEIRFDGQWTSGDVIQLVCIPQSDVDTVGTPKNYITQGVVNA